MQESEHEFYNKRQTGNFGTHAKSKLSNRLSKDSSKNTHNFGKLIEREDSHPKNILNNSGENHSQRANESKHHHVQFGTVKEVEKSTPNRNKRKRHRRRETKNAEETPAHEKRIAPNVSPARSKSKKKKGFMSNFMEMLGFGCCGSR